jgi:hypothetical protein
MHTHTHTRTPAHTPPAASQGFSNIVFTFGGERRGDGWAQARARTPALHSRAPTDVHLDTITPAPTTRQPSAKPNAPHPPTSSRTLPPQTQGHCMLIELADSQFRPSHTTPHHTAP